MGEHVRQAKSGRPSAAFKAKETSMPRAPAPSGSIGTLADLLEQLGDIPANRVRFHPFPGTATEKDVLTLHDREGKLLCELVDGVLVDKALGFRESVLAGLLIHCLWNYLNSHDLGIVLGPDGAVRLRAGLVRIPDVSFVSWDRLPGKEIPDAPFPDLAPELAIEVLSNGNTPKEMKRKVSEYFGAGVRLVWLVDPKQQIVDIYTARDQIRRLAARQTLDGGEVLPGFTLPLRKLFAKPGKGRANR
jgi:Uma2 family endonuclease